MMTSFYVSRIFVDVMLEEILNYAANIAKKKKEEIWPSPMKNALDSPKMYVRERRSKGWRIPD